MVGNTDSKHFWNVARSLYRFCPTILDKVGENSVKMFHGRNEKISIENLGESALYYRTLIVHADSSD
jgi:acetylornithine deacetylase/succinyl-diaminopimelate desuccinylase-like protein